MISSIMSSKVLLSVSSVHSVRRPFQGAFLKVACTVTGAGEGFFRDRGLSFEQLRIITPLLLPRPRNWLIIRFAS